MSKQTVAQLHGGMLLCNKKENLLTPASKEMKFNSSCQAKEARCKNVYNLIYIEL